MKKYLIIGSILLFLCFILILYNEINSNKINNNLVNIYTITNTGRKDENVLVYLDATFLAGNIMDDYYVFFGDGVQYLVKINDELAYKINKYLLDNPEDSYRLYGKTKLISNELEEPGIKFIKNWLDTNHNHHTEEDAHSHDITIDEFYHYFGHVYLDYQDNIYNNQVIKVIVYITGLIGGLFILKYVTMKYNFL